MDFFDSTVTCRRYETVTADVVTTARQLAALSAGSLRCPLCLDGCRPWIDQFRVVDGSQRVRGLAWNGTGWVER